MATFTYDPVTLVTKVESSQMGVTVQLGGIDDFSTYLTTEVEDGTLTQDEADYYLSRSDGYYFQWAFDTPAIVPTADGALDAACITSAHASGGFCAGLVYTGDSLTTNFFAYWMDQSEFDGFDTVTAMYGLNDIDMWVNETTDYTSTWTVGRYLPYWQFYVSYYGAEYRFSPDTPDAYAWAYYSADATTYSLEKQNDGSYISL